MKSDLLSVEDAVFTLSRTALPSLVVEGGSDVIVLRRLEEIVSDVQISVLPVGGRDTVLGVFERRAELGADKCILFFVDQDFWIFAGKPNECVDADLETTWGYSIENDMFLDGDLTRLLTVGERQIFEQELDQFIDWFSNRVRQHLDGVDGELGLHPNQVLSLPQEEVADAELRAQMGQQYGQALRGKSLFALLIRQLSSPTRAAKYSYANLLELGATSSGPNLMRVRDWLLSRLQDHGCIPAADASPS